MMSYEPEAYPAYGHHTSLSLDTKIPMVADPSRTPSPTEAEFNYLNNINQKKSIWKWIKTILPVVLVFTAFILISVFHDQIVDVLKPFTDWMQQHNLYGSLVIIGAMIIVSFPPLIGHEILAVLCGVSFEFGDACIVDALGTILGEVANYFVFKYACSARGRKLEEQNIEYGAMAHVVREGGFWIVLIMRYSAIPAHLATPIFSTVGVPFGVFLAAAILSVPKTFVPVYVGWAAKPENSGNKIAQIVSKVVLGVAVLITIGAMWWINRKMKQSKEDYIYSRRKTRQAKGKGPAYISVPLGV
ncbi:hypothetical protein MVEN_02521500 [Mycena venus]|uniref:Golgi apparatus membrane protein TVP38 n=1 Tax=Mycena venus TaxID=2733690 RepID=A0A8H7CA97_9AGAR|nr:hypothetical protein MVEN_02521500 [Mycena venus]